MDDHLSDVSQQDGNRAAQRDSLFLLAELADTAGTSLGQVRVRNLSATGLMADCAALLGPGSEVVITLRNIGPVHGRIAWSRNGRIGLAFQKEIDPQLVRKPVGESRPSSSMPVYLRSVPQLPRRGY